MDYNSFINSERGSNGSLPSIVLYHPCDYSKTINVFFFDDKFWFDTLDVAMHLGYDVEEDDDVGVHYDFLDGIVSEDNRIDTGDGYIAVDIIGLLDLIKESNDEYHKNLMFNWAQWGIFRIGESVEEAIRMGDRL